MAELVERLKGTIRNVRDKSSKGLKINVGRRERALSLLAGGFMLVDGLRRGGVRGIMEGVLGSGMLYRGATGYCGVYGTMGIDLSEQWEREVRAT